MHRWGQGLLRFQQSQLVGSPAGRCTGKLMLAFVSLLITEYLFELGPTGTSGFES
jgi:hypothetical protein